MAVMAREAGPRHLVGVARPICSDRADAGAGTGTRPGSCIASLSTWCRRRSVYWSINRWPIEGWAGIGHIGHPLPRLALSAGSTSQIDAVDRIVPAKFGSPPDNHGGQAMSISGA